MSDNPVQATTRRGPVVMDRRVLPYGTCELCSAQGKELRPYGPNGERICFPCGMRDEATTGKRFMQVVFKERFDA